MKKKNKTIEGNQPLCAKITLDIKNEEEREEEEREERERRRRRREGARSLPAPMVNSQESVDLQGLLGLLHVSSSTEHETEKENAKSGKTRTTTTATATAAKPRAEDELRGWTTRSNESRRKGGHERSEEYREKVRRMRTKKEEEGRKTRERKLLF